MRALACSGWFLNFLYSTDLTEDFTTRWIGYREALTEVYWGRLMLLLVLKNPRASWLEGSALILRVTPVTTFGVRKEFSP